MVAEEHLDFLHAVWTRRTPFTFIFLAINITVFLLMEYVGSTTDPATLMAFGVKSNPEILDGEIWRLVTPIFIHIGVLHLFFNSYALWMVGQQVEKLYGSARFVLLYFLTGVAGVLGSFFNNPEAMSAGASGAIMGLFGVLLVFGLRYRHSIPPFFKKAVGAGVLPVIVINLVIGFYIPAIDNSAHISGLVSGAILAWIVPYLMPGGRTHSIFKAVQVAFIAIILASFYAVAVNFHGSPTTFVDTVNNAQRAFSETAESLKDERTGEISALGDQVAKSIDELRNIPSMNRRADELMQSLLELMEQHYALIQDIDRSGVVTFNHRRRLDELSDRYEAIMRSFSQWVADEGNKFGIQMGKRP